MISEHKTPEDLALYPDDHGIDIHRPETLERLHGWSKDLLLGEMEAGNKEREGLFRDDGGPRRTASGVLFHRGRRARVLEA